MAGNGDQLSWSQFWFLGRSLWLFRIRLFPQHADQHASTAIQHNRVKLVLIRFTPVVCLARLRPDVHIHVVGNTSNLNFVFPGSDGVEFLRPLEIERGVFFAIPEQHNFSPRQVEALGIDFDQAGVGRQVDDHSGQHYQWQKHHSGG